VFDVPLETLELLAEISTAGVIVGLFIEYVPPLVERIKTPRYERSLLRYALIHALGPILVIGGIAFELALHIAISSIQNERDTEQQIIITDTRKHVANLEKETADANARTAIIMRTTAWREFSPAQIESLFHALSAHPKKVVIGWVFNIPFSPPPAHRVE
jgi:hypothetical protein